MNRKVGQIRKTKTLSKTIADIMEARKDPEFQKFIKEFIAYHTGPKQV